MILSGDNRITAQQMELLNSFKHLRTEAEIAEVKELLRLYFENKLEAAIDKAETDRGYTQEVYDAWLARQKKAS